MEFGNILVIFLLMYYTFYFISILSKKNRIVIQDKNTKLDELRKKPIKTLEEQKEFISLKYPKKEKYKFQWKHLLRVFFVIFVGITVMYGYSKLFSLFDIRISLFYAILILIISPIIINFFLAKMHLEKEDVLLYIIGKQK